VFSRSHGLERIRGNGREKRKFSLHEGKIKRMESLDWRAKRQTGKKKDQRTSLELAQERKDLQEVQNRIKSLKAERKKVKRARS